MFQGRTATVNYRNGILSGDQEAIDKARYENTQDHGYLGPVPADVNKDYLRYDLPAYDLLAMHVFDTVVSEDNDWEPYDPEAVY
jgi:hypothetical protein